jgi:hypothetical protein
MKQKMQTIADEPDKDKGWQKLYLFEFFVAALGNLGLRY